MKYLENVLINVNFQQKCNIFDEPFKSASIENVIEKVIISDISSIFSTIIVETCTTMTMLIQIMCEDFY